MAKSYWSYRWASGWAWQDGWQWLSISGKMADYLPYKEPDYDAEFPLSAAKLSDSVDTLCKVTETDDGDEERVSMSLPDFRVTLHLPRLTKNQLESLIDFYINETKANGKLRSFKWTHPADGCVYVVRFDSDLVDVVRHGLFTDELDVALRVLGWNKLSLD